jgi:hypothetical protein
MKNILLFTILVFCFTTVKAQTADYLQKKEFQTEKKKIYDNIDAVKKPSSELKKLVARQSLKIDSLSAVVKAFGAQNKSFADSINKMSVSVLSLNGQVQANESKLSKSYGDLLMMVVILLILVVGTFIILWRKNKKTADILNDHREMINAKLVKVTEAIRSEIADGVATMKAMSEELNQKLAGRIDRFEAEHGQVHMKIQDNTSSLKDQIETIKETAEEKIKTVKSDLAAKANELLSQTNALKVQMDKEIQALLSEFKKAKSN